MPITIEEAQHTRSRLDAEQEALKAMADKGADGDPDFDAELYYDQREWLTESERDFYAAVLDTIAEGAADAAELARAALPAQE